MKDDWRLQGQARFLTGKTLYKIRFAKQSDEWDHEHCAFCWAKFSDFEEDLHEGYCTEPSITRDAHWICPECCKDFRAVFGWKLCEPVSDEADPRFKANTFCSPD